MKNERNKIHKHTARLKEKYKSNNDKHTIEVQNSQRFARAQCIGQRFCSFIPDIIDYKVRSSKI